MVPPEGVSAVCEYLVLVYSRCRMLRDFSLLVLPLMSFLERLTSYIIVKLFSGLKAARGIAPQMLRVCNIASVESGQFSSKYCRQPRFVSTF